MRLIVAVFVSLMAPFAALAPQVQKPLVIYAVDVEGGKSTLVVSPSGESILIDTGNIGNGSSRDAGRIMAAIADAGLRHIDHLVTTHWHRDHVGAMPLVAARIPIREFIDHGANVQPDAAVDAFLAHTYPALLAKSTHTVAKAGHRISMDGMDVRIVASQGEVISGPVPGAGAPNPFCAGIERPRIAANENTQSLGLSIVFGKFRLLDLGDLTSDREFDLMCPANRLGAVDLFMVSHHGQANSNSHVLVHGIEPRVAVMNNGLRKGGQPDVMEAIHTAPGLEDLWQLHFPLLGGQDYSAPGVFIANSSDEPAASVPVAPISRAALDALSPPPPAHEGTAFWIRISARPDGSFAVTNSRNGFAKTYSSRDAR